MDNRESRNTDYSRRLYIDLLIKVICNTIYEDPTMEPWATEPVYDSTKRETGLDWPRVAHSMAGVARITNVAQLAEEIIRTNVKGNFIETGVWRGGCCILMRGILKAYEDADRKIFVCDSFQGLPKPDAEKYSADKDDPHHKYSELAVSKDKVSANFERYGLLDEKVVFVEGFFEKTLPYLDTGPLALLRLDGDMYGSTIVALESLYSKLSPGGFCIIDDYGAVPACRQAVTDFRTKYGIDAPMNTIDWTGVWWQRPVSSSD